VKRSELIRQLVQQGCVLLRHGGRHDIYHNPATGQKQTRTAPWRDRQCPGQTHKEVPGFEGVNTSATRGCAPGRFQASLCQYSAIVRVVPICVHASCPWRIHSLSESACRKVIFIRWSRVRISHRLGSDGRHRLSTKWMGRFWGLEGTKAGRTAQYGGTDGAVALSKIRSCARRVNYEARGRGFKSCRARQ
jgi:hypothetical protein